MSPNQKLGMEAPAKAKRRRELSTQLLGLTAAITPAGIPRPATTRRAMIPKKMLVSARCPMIRSTGWRKKMDSPKFPRKKLAKYL